VIDGEPVGELWGAVPFAVPFNVAGLPAASLPCGLVNGLPVGVQLIAPALGEQLLLDMAEELEEAITFERAPVIERWARRPVRS
jgi:Asp-tRNA(Asn)/Glu-tRNA(Gln) amidotransferase A subunit family amidase